MEPCETTWLNYTDKDLLVGGEDVLTQITNEQCAEVCAYNITDCVAVRYHYTTLSCVVHRDINDLTSMIDGLTYDIYVMIRCNDTGRLYTVCETFLKPRLH